MTTTVAILFLGGFAFALVYAWTHWVGLSRWMALLAPVILVYKVSRFVAKAPGRYDALPEAIVIGSVFGLLFLLLVSPAMRKNQLGRHGDWRLQVGKIGCGLFVIAAVGGYLYHQIIPFKLMIACVLSFGSGLVVMLLSESMGNDMNKHVRVKMAFVMLCSVLAGSSSIFLISPEMPIKIKVASYAAIGFFGIGGLLGLVGVMTDSVWNKLPEPVKGFDMQLLAPKTDPNKEMVIVLNNGKNRKA